jgi:hypothetical protein
MSKRDRNKNGAFGGGKKKHHPEVNFKLSFDLCKPEFGNEAVQVLPHTAPNFREVLTSLDWHQQWAQIWNGLLERYRARPTLPHQVYEVFIRGGCGYLPIIVRCSAPDGTPQVRGMLASVGLNPEAAQEDVSEALYELGASACTQLMTQLGQSFVHWEKPPKF